MDLIPHVNPGDEVVIWIFLGFAFVGCGILLCCPGGWFVPSSGGGGGGSPGTTETDESNDICCVSSHGGSPQATETDELNGRNPFQRFLTMFRPCEPNQADIEEGRKLDIG